jgi:hypothetical protein
LPTSIVFPEASEFTSCSMPLDAARCRSMLARCRSMPFDPYAARCRSIPTPLDAVRSLRRSMPLAMSFPFHLILIS